MVSGMRTKLGMEDGIPVVGYDYWSLPGMPEVMKRLCPTDKGSVGHAGEFETSAQLHLQPALVAVQEAVWALGGFGDPSAGTGEKGKQLIEAAVEALVRLLRVYQSGELEDRLGWRKDIPE